MTDKNNDEVLWITVEHPTEEECKTIRDTLGETALADKYEIIITDDRIETIGIDELKEALEQ